MDNVTDNISKYQNVFDTLKRLNINPVIFTGEDANDFHTTIGKSNMQLLDDCIKNGISYKAIAFCADDSFTLHQRNALLMGLNSGVPFETIERYIHPGDNEWTTLYIVNALCEGISEDVTDKYLIPEKNEGDVYKLYIITEALINDITPEYLDQLRYKRPNGEQLHELLKAKEKECTDEQILFLDDPRYNPQQIREGAYGFLGGLKQKQVASYYKPEIKWHEMAVRRDILLKGEHIETVYDKNDKIIRRHRCTIDRNGKIHKQTEGTKGIRHITDIFRAAHITIGH